jgi:hypothetical protein
MKFEEKVKKIKKDNSKFTVKSKSNRNYIEMKKAIQLLEKNGLFHKPNYNLQTIENRGIIIPHFTNVYEEIN